MKKVAVILCGSGYRDGSEIRESVAALWALSEAGAEAHCFAPNGPQNRVVNCLTGEVVAGESRNMLVESARIARAKVKPLTDLHPRDFDAVILPGGFGAALNLCTFGTQGSKGHVIPELQKILDEAYAAQKPIGAICIAPAILALAFKGKNLTLTVGAGGEAAQEIEKLGHTHQVCAVNDCVIDEANHVVTTPAYMYDDAKLHELFQGVKKAVGAVLSRTHGK